MTSPQRAVDPDSRGLRVLWTSPYLPWPATNGGKARQYGLLRQLGARGHDITLVALCREVPRPAELEHLRCFLGRVVAVPRRPRTSPVTLLRAALASDRPAVATVNGCAPDYAREFGKLLREPGWDVVQVEHSYGFEPLAQALRRRNARYVLTEHNVESRLVPLQWARLPGALRPLAALDQLRAARWERRVIRGAGCVVAVTREDEAEFRAIGATATAMVPNCVDTAAFAGVRRDAGAGRLLFLGNYDYAPNVDAVRWLCDEILPRLWISNPEARLAVRGSAMPAAEWRRRWPDPRIEFAGWAASVAAAHAEASIFVAPLRAGGGSKLKVIEALASGLPVVGTIQAMSGLAARPGKEFIDGGTDAGSFAAAASAALSDSGMAASVGAAARLYATAHHDWHGAADALERVWERHAARA